MLHAQMKTTTVNSGGRITARPRTSERRNGSKELTGLAFELDIAMHPRREHFAFKQPCDAAIRSQADELFYVFATYPVAVRKIQKYRNGRK
jgi:hypothetical protein